jgi:hypothetical protein
VAAAAVGGGGGASGGGRQRRGAAAMGSGGKAGAGLYQVMMSEFRPEGFAKPSPREKQIIKNRLLKTSCQKQVLEKLFLDSACGY